MHLCILVNPDNPDINRSMEQMCMLWFLCRKAQKLTSHDTFHLICNLRQSIYPVVYIPLLNLFELNSGLPGLAIVPLGLHTYVCHHVTTSRSLGDMHCYYWSRTVSHASSQDPQYTW